MCKTIKTFDCFFNFFFFFFLLEIKIINVKGRFAHKHHFVKHRVISRVLIVNLNNRQRIASHRVHRIARCSNALDPPK